MALNNVHIASKNEFHAFYLNDKKFSPHTHLFWALTLFLHIVALKTFEFETPGIALFIASYHP